MYILGINTTSSKASVSLSKDGEIICAKKSSTENSHAETLITLVDRVINKFISLNEINYLAFSAGPGSFTGIRIGLSTIKSFDFTLKNISKSYVSAISITNFELLRKRSKEQIKDKYPSIHFIDGGRGEFFIQSFDKNCKSNKINLLKKENIKEFLYNIKEKTIISGSGIDKFIDDYISQKFIILPRFPYPDARYVCKVASDKIVTGEIDSKIIPLYIRDADAKVPTKHN